MQGTRPGKEWARGLHKKTQSLPGRVALARQRPTAELNSGGEGRHARPGGDAAAPQQNARELPAVTTQKFWSIRQICWPNSWNAILHACSQLPASCSPTLLSSHSCSGYYHNHVSKCAFASADGATTSTCTPVLTLQQQQQPMPPQLLLTQSRRRRLRCLVLPLLLRRLPVRQRCFRRRSCLHWQPILLLQQLQPLLRLARCRPLLGHHLRRLHRHRCLCHRRRR